ncbi:MAG: serine dehydratase [Bacteroidetes bacterium]|nr:MAG: serine dehydratase [Bacteroidota bacterium]
MVPNHIPSKEDILAAHERIAEYIHMTPILTSKTIDKFSGASVFFKCENFQKVGAFKKRGATNAILCLSDEQKANGVITHSSGNHGQAVALAAGEQGIKATVVMPDNSPAVKIEATKGYGAEVVFCSANIENRREIVDRVINKTGAHFIPPFNDYQIIAGQATAAKELIEEIENLDIIIAPIGGGGLISGTCLSAKYFSPSTTVIGAEPEEVDDAFRSLKSGEIESNASTNTIAEGLKTPLGDKTFPIIREYVEEIITVTESEIIEALKLIWERMKIIVEPSSAVPLAALLNSKEKFQSQKIGIILTGGNIDVKSALFGN